jgi:hypothetical protein
MTRPVPAITWLSARSDAFRAMTAQPAAEVPRAASGDLLLTVPVDEPADRAAWRFAFRAAGSAERRKCFRRRSDQDCGAAFDRPYLPRPFPDPHDSSRFLASALAQARPHIALPDPRHREAASAYRRSDRLGTDVDDAVHRSVRTV